MRKLNPILLDVLYRAGCYPFDDIDLDDGNGRPASVWVMPKGPLPLFIAIRGNGTSAAALIAELHRIHGAFKVHHGNVPQGQGWGYLVTVQCENTHSRVIGREMRQFEPEEIAVGLNAYAFIPWFNPPSDYDDVYESDDFVVDMLPPSELEQDDDGLYTSREWEDAADSPESLEASFARSLGLDELSDVGAPRSGGFSLDDPFAYEHDDDDDDEDYGDDGDDDDGDDDDDDGGGDDDGDGDDGDGDDGEDTE
jgi:hypothetical protein